MKNRQQLLIVLTITVVALFAGDKVIVGPLTNLWHARSGEIKKLRTDIANGNSLIKDGDALRSRWDRMQTNTLPNDSKRATEQALKVLQEYALESGATLVNFNPQWKSDKDEYKTLVCNVDASGNLWNLTRFVFNIEKGPTAMKIESLNLASTDNTGQQLNLRLQASGLVLNSPRQ